MNPCNGLTATLGVLTSKQTTMPQDCYSPIIVGAVTPCMELPLAGAARRDSEGLGTLEVDV